MDYSTLTELSWGPTFKKQRTILQLSYKTEKSGDCVHTLPEPLGNSHSRGHSVHSARVPTGDAL